MTDSTPLRLLIKTPDAIALNKRGFAIQGSAARVEPLFNYIGRTRKTLAAASAAQWQLVTLSDEFDFGRAWDACHALMRDGLGVAKTAVAPEFAEPDFPQQWPIDNHRAAAFAFDGACDVQAPQNIKFPTNADPLWHLDPSHSDLRRAQPSTPPTSGRVRVAHLDTGYDPNQVTRPVNLNTTLQRNYVDAKWPNDATDRTDGVLTNPGHGTGTLSLLAGAPVPNGLNFGGVPFAEVIPIRVANRVVLFWNSAIAKAFDYVYGLSQAKATFVDVITMSMGGLASQAWAEAINHLYDAGVFVVTAAGNNFNSLPTRNIVYPARFNRVVAACGVMGNGKPYADLGGGLMAGNYGPASKMRTAAAAFTPNVPWARRGCASTVDLDGGGTSAATPQLAASAALWIQRNRAALESYPQPWMRVEAVRQALFGSARANNEERTGHGTLSAKDMMGIAPPPAKSLTAEAPDTAAFGLLRVLTGLGVAGAPTGSQRLLELEALQLSQTADVEAVMGGRDASALAPMELQRVVQAFVENPRVSSALKAALRPALPVTVPLGTPILPNDGSVAQAQLRAARDPQIPVPARRRLRVFALDPSMGQDLATASLTEATIEVRWEPNLKIGPIGEYLEVVDVDPPSTACYAPVDLNHPHLLVQDGLSPSEANPQFHQQMVYAVAMRTIEFFERALGRVALWAPHKESEKARFEDGFLRRLRLYPHALREANAYYSPDRKAILFGYFRSAQDAQANGVMPGALVFSCLSHDIVAHETTHALLDGLHRRFREPTNPDVLAFHEAFADIVALLQHFTIPEALIDTLAKARGEFAHADLLSGLAREFGRATGRNGALRQAIKLDEDGKVVPPSPADYEQDDEPHARGAVLVAAVFDAFLKIYADRTQDVVLIATGGTGVLPDGRLPAELTRRLAIEASKVAGQVLTICIRGLDYCPPTDITFGEYLRALITADRDLVPDDKRTYRIAFIAAFRARGIYPPNVRNLSIESVAWEAPALQLTHLDKLFAQLDLRWDLKADREEVFARSRKNANLVWEWLHKQQNVSDVELDALGLVRLTRPTPREVAGQPGELRRIEVHAVRPAHRIGPDGERRDDVIIEITQTWRPAEQPDARFRGGCTLIIDLEQRQIRYLIRKQVANSERVGRQMGFMLSTLQAQGENPYFDDTVANRETFAILHRH